jgi:hypothetical protein
MLNQGNNTKPRRPAINGGISTTARFLAQRMDDLARHLLGKPNKKLSTSTELRFGNKGSMSVNIGGAEPGVWFDHEAGKGGGALELIQHIRRCDLKAACAWADDWLGLSPQPATLVQLNKQNGAPVPAAEPNTRTVSPAEPPSAPTEFAAKVANILVQSGPANGTPAETYLRSRGITLDLPNSIGYRADAIRKYGALVGLATHGRRTNSVSPPS